MRFGGFVKLGNAGLVRSLVVAGAARGRGVGSSVLRGLIAEARALGITDLWLLTTTAEPFFVKHGFQPAAREQAPGEVAQTAQFKDLCPSSAVLMRRDLRR